MASSHNIFWDFLEGSDFYFLKLIKKKNDRNLNLQSITHVLILCCILTCLSMVNSGFLSVSITELSLFFGWS